MASTVLVKDVLWRVSILLGDTLPQFKRWSERELVHWLNDARIAITKALPLANVRVDAIKLPNDSYHSIETIAAADCIPGDGSTPTVPIYGTQFLRATRNMGLDGLERGKAIRMVDREDMDAAEPDWSMRVGANVTSCIFDPLQPLRFGTYPSTKGLAWIEIAYCAVPIPITNTAAAGSEAYLNSGSSTVTLGIADQYVEECVDYVLSRAHQSDVLHAEPVKAIYHEQRFINSLKSKLAASGGTDPNLSIQPGG